MKFFIVFKHENGISLKTGRHFFLAIINLKKSLQLGYFKEVISDVFFMRNVCKYLILPDITSESLSGHGTKFVRTDFYTGSVRRDVVCILKVEMSVQGNREKSIQESQTFLEYLPFHPFSCKSKLKISRHALAAFGIAQ